MNERDSEFVAGLFLDKGYKLVDCHEDADIVLFNTCSIRAHAEQRAVSNMGALLSKAKGKSKKIFGLIGCMAQAQGKDLLKRLPGLNIVCGTGEIARLPELVESAGKKSILALDNIDSPLPELNPSYRKDRKHAYVSIMNGCDNFCSYCVVPYVRGSERSRKAEDIINEIKDLATRGITEITLLGQNVNSYMGLFRLAYGESRNDKLNNSGTPRNDKLSTEKYNFVQLLEAINEIDGIKKIVFMTSHPKDASEELFQAMAKLDKVFKHLHLPLQSGSDRILILMNRGYTSKNYLELVEKARKIIPGLRLTTDVIVGFPTETEVDFENTFDLIKKIEFDLAYVFKYSARPGTEAAKLKDDVAEDVKKTRHKKLLDLQMERKKLIGTGPFRTSPRKNSQK